MKKIALSLVTVVALLALTVGATSAVFTSTASVTGNTWSTGSLEVRINGQTSITGFVVPNSVPGDSKTGDFTIQNYGPESPGPGGFLSGPSTLPAKSLKISAVRTLAGADSEKLFNKLKVRVRSTVDWNTTVVFNDGLSNLVDKEILLPSNTLPVGWSMPIEYQVLLPDNAGNAYQGLTTTFDFVVTASAD